MASTYLTRTPSSAGNKQKFTISAWVKKASVGSAAHTIMCASNGGNRDAIMFDNNKLAIFKYDSGYTYQLRTNRLFRDSNAWYHIVVAYDTTQATASNRIKLYINGEQESDWESGWQTYPSQNFNTLFNDAFAQIIGKDWDSSNYFDGNISHFHLCDGYAYSPTDFGETDSTTGIWKPKTVPTGINYGTNGFFLKFENSANMGLDSSGQGNNYSVSGGTMTKLIDTPSNVFATLNPLDTGLPGTTLNLANGNNTTMNTSGYGDYGVRSTLGASSGKYYWEAKYTTGNCTGIQPMDTKLIFDMFGSTPEAHVYGIQRYNDSSTNFFSNTTFTSQNTAAWGGITSGDIIGYALDLDNGKIFCSKNGNFKDLSGNTGDPVNGNYPTFTIADTDRVYGAYVELRTNNDNGTKMNFGNGYFGTTAVSSAQNPDDGIGIFEYDVPAGYRALCTKSINAEEYS